MTQKGAVSERARRARRRVEPGGEHAPRAALAEAIECLLVLHAASVLRDDRKWAREIDRTFARIDKLVPGMRAAVREGIGASR